MTDYRKLVKALRHCNGPSWLTCQICQYNNDMMTCAYKMLRDAAAAIEALQEKVDKQDAEITELLAVITKKDTELDNIKTELLNAQDEAKYERQRLRLCEENLEATLVSETTYREMCEALQAQLPKRGKWIKHPEVKNIYGGVYIECPFCGEKYVVQYIADEKFCRNCGADMRKMEVQDGQK